MPFLISITTRFCSTWTSEGVYQLRQTGTNRVRLLRLAIRSETRRKARWRSPLNDTNADLIIVHRFSFSFSSFSCSFYPSILLSTS
jgi:hypothetical protein